MILPEGNEEQRFFVVIEQIIELKKKKTEKRNEIHAINFKDFSSQPIGFLMGDLLAIAHEAGSDKLFGFIYDHEGQCTKGYQLDIPEESESEEEDEEDKDSEYLETIKEEKIK